ncbi:MAG: GPR endopeptidase [Clostridia bacterium]|nr:GPR endopeptidase [Clostridia bacterium]
MNIRTDLIAEQQTSCKNININAKQEKIGLATLDTVIIDNQVLSKEFQKPMGRYCTVSFPRLYTVCDTDDIIKATVRAFKSVSPVGAETVLVVGLGNCDITPDALGPLVCGRVLATRHLSNNLKQSIGLEKLNSVCCITPGVLGKTGIESYDIIKAATTTVKPDIIIAVDALACRSAERLCRTIQLSDSGISPGAGVNNSRRELSHDTVGVPVIAVGVPTVIDANSFFDKSDDNMMVTPKEIDLLIEKSADIISRAINIFLQPSLDISIIESLT